MGNLLGHKQSGYNESKIIQILPTELMKKILENLDCKSLDSARLCCKRWKEIIDVFQLKEKALGKFAPIWVYFQSLNSLEVPSAPLSSFDPAKSFNLLDFEILLRASSKNQIWKWQEIENASNTYPWH